MMKTLLFLLISLTAIVSLACAQATATTPPRQKSAGFDPRRDAEKDISNAIVLAKKNNKRILLDVGGEW